MQFTGTVIEAKLQESTVYGTNYGSKERYTHTLKVVMRTHDAQTIQFYSPTVESVVNWAVGCPIAIVTCQENDWVVAVKSESDKSLSLRPVSRLNLGDRITVSGRIKSVTDKVTKINYVKLIDCQPFAGQLPDKEYAFNPGDCIIVCDGMGKQVNTLHQMQKYGHLKDSEKLVDVLAIGYSQDIEKSEIQALRDNVANGADGDWDAFFSRLLIKQQEVYYLACWLDNRKEKSILKKKVQSAM